MKVGGASKLKTGESAARSGQAEPKGSAISGASEATRSFAEVTENFELQAIISDLDTVGAAMSRYPTSTLLRQYKELVRQALARVKNGSRIKREFKWRRTERSMFMVIERTEEALGEIEELESALERERERTRILSLIDEIKGCLLSLIF
ncbi:MAG: YaaR family protein [Synergistaceae bacterium]|nr:YaaR family protein [Synergistaceae bacterium]